MNSNSLEKSQFSEVPELTLLFWIIKIVATTLGETAGDALSMSLDLGYLISTEIFCFSTPRGRKKPTDLFFTEVLLNIVKKWI